MDELPSLFVLQGLAVSKLVLATHAPGCGNEVPHILSFSGLELARGHILTSRDLRISLRIMGQSFLLT